MQQQVVCGCKRHNVNMDDCCYYQDSWWLPHCFCLKIDKRIGILTDKTRKLKDQYGKLLARYVELKKYVRKNVTCWHCGNNVGNRWGFIGQNLVCGKCRKNANLGV
jgi:hypothetical protein